MSLFVPWTSSMVPLYASSKDGQIVKAINVTSFEALKFWIILESFSRYLSTHLDPWIIKHRRHADTMLHLNRFRHVDIQKVTLGPNLQWSGFLGGAIISWFYECALKEYCSHNEKKSTIYLSFFIQYNEQENWLCLRNCKNQIGLVLSIEKKATNCKGTIERGVQLPN